MQRLAMVPAVPNRTTMNRKASSAALPRIFLLVFLFALAAIPTWAKEHPVPLDKNVDSAKCLECHEDKTKGKSVHSAIAMGCLSCHEVRVNKDITRIKLITTTPQALCLTCHAEKDAATLKGTVHPPAVRDCIKCHDPHTSDNKNQLLKAGVRRQGQESLPRLPQARAERPRKRQPPCRARHGMRHLPHDPQNRRSGQSRV